VEASPIRVLVAEDDFLVREGVRRLIDEQDGLRVVGEAHDLDSVLAQADLLRPDVVVMDIKMPPRQSMEGIEATRHIRQRAPGTGVVVLTQHDDEEYVWELLKNGVAGLAYLRKIKVSHAGELAHAIREVARGGSVVDAQIVAKLIDSRRRGRSPLDALTSGEMDVLRLMAEGKNNAAIAQGLSLSLAAIEKRISAVFGKLALAEEGDVHRRVAAVLLYLKERPTE
jgi:DNA-binding NarL/FixJ family response regulator